jgi:threonine dehydratase
MPLDLPTPLAAAPPEVSGGRSVFLKHEEKNELGAFKWRGALPALQRWREQGASVVVTASTGNHGAATSWAARRLGMQAIVYAPGGASHEKIGLIEHLGARIRLVGADFDEAKAEAAAYAARAKLPFFEDGAEPAQYKGYEAIGEEICRQCERPGTVVVPVGNGALIAGLGAAVRRLAPGARVVGVAAKDAPVMEMSWRTGRAVPCDRGATFADGLAVRIAIPAAVAQMRETVDQMLLVSERALALGVAAFAGIGLRVEGAAAAGLAALPQLGMAPEPLVLVVTGGNIDEDVWVRAVDNPESFPE